MAEYIEREAVKEAIGFINLHFVACGEKKSLLDVINEVPAVDVAPVVYGRWVYDEHEMEYSCSVCLHEAPVGMTTYYTTNYCPNCGTDMRGE